MRKSVTATVLTAATALGVLATTGVSSARTEAEATSPTKAHVRVVYNAARHYAAAQGDDSPEQKPVELEYQKTLPILGKFTSGVGDSGNPGRTDTNVEDTNAAPEDGPFRACADYGLNFGNGGFNHRVCTPWIDGKPDQHEASTG